MYANQSGKKKSSVRITFSSNCSNGSVSGNLAVLHHKCVSTVSRMIALTCLPWHIV